MGNTSRKKKQECGSEPFKHKLVKSFRSKNDLRLERNRRIQMEALYSELNSLLPQTSRDSLPLPDQLDEAANYINKLHVNVEKKRERKRKLLATAALEKLNSTGSSSPTSSSADVSVPRRLPRIEIQESGLILHISLVTSLEHKFMFHEIIRVLTDESGAEITHAGYSVGDDAVFHTLDCKVEDCDSGALSRISESLKKLVNTVN